jgi:hypothetical protein
MISFSGLSGSEAAKRLEEVLHRNLGNVQDQVKKVFSEEPVDRKVPAEEVQWEVELDGTVFMSNKDASLNLPMHGHAMQHVYNISGVPASFSRRLREKDEPWASELLAHNLNETWSRLRTKGGRPPVHLVRAKEHSSLGGQLGMAVLSSSYKTIDTRPLLEAFLEKATELGAVPYQARGTDLQFAMKMVLPRVQMVGEDPYVFGLEYRNTDWGGTAAGLTAFIMRLACLNGMTTEKVFRKIHMGSRLDRDAEWSKKTRALENEATISAIGDMTKAFLLPERQESIAAQLAKAGETEVSLDKVENTLKGKVPVADVKRTVEILTSADPRVPRTLGSRISWLDAAQALSAASQDTLVRDETAEDSVLDMERLSGKLMNMGVAA